MFLNGLLFLSAAGVGLILSVKSSSTSLSVAYWGCIVTANVWFAAFSLQKVLGA